MNNLVNWFTRKKLVLVGFLSSLIFLFLVPRDMLSKICPTNQSICIDSFNYLLLILMFGIMLFLFSIISFFIKDKVFKSWKKTLFIYSFIYLFIIVITPWSAGDAFFRVQKDLIAVGISIIYFVFSIIFVIYKSLKKE